MSRRETLFLVKLGFWVAFIAIDALYHFDADGERRPTEAAPPSSSGSRAPESDRVRRPLPELAAADTVFAIESEPMQAGELLQGTAFSVDPRGVWVTARHVASEGCRDLVMILNGHRTQATLSARHPEWDLALINTAEGSPALPIETTRPAIGDTGYSFGFPSEMLGATQDILMGRSRIEHRGRLVGTTPSLTWAETRRFPDTLESLGGMSGGPMFDAQGRLDGILVAASARRGRVISVAPELLRQVANEAGFPDETAAVAEVADRTLPISDAARALARDSRIVKLYCRPRV